MFGDLFWFVVCFFLKRIMSITEISVYLTNTMNASFSVLY